MTDTPQGAWMREYERLRLGIVAPHMPAEFDASLDALDARVRGLVDALAKYESIREQMEERGYVYVESSRVWKDLREAGKLAHAALATPNDAP